MEAEALPTFFGHAIKVYSMLEREAVGVVREDGTIVRQWTGFFTHTIKDAGFSSAYYSRIKPLLIELGCVTQVRRGGGTAPTVFILNHPPVVDDFHQFETRRHKRVRVVDLAQRLGALEDILIGWDLKDALRNLDERLQVLEGRSE